jgi:signal transduction histidine kinase
MTEATDPPDRPRREPADREAAFEIERANWYFSKLPMIYVGNLVGAVGLTGALALAGSRDPWLLAWVGAVVLHVVLCRTWTWWPSRSAITERAAARYWGRYLVGSSLVQGLVWAAAPLAFLTSDAFVVPGVLVLVANVAAAVALLSSHPSAYAAFSIPVTLATAIALYGSGPAGALLAAMCIIFLGFCLLLSLDTHHTIATSLRLRIEREGLLGRLEEQIDVASRALREKDRFMAAVSHDLRQPVAALGLLIAQLDAGGGRLDRDVADRTRRALRRLDDLVRGLLDTANLDAGRVVVQPEDFLLEDRFEALRVEFEPIAAATGTVLQVRPTGAVVHSDPLQLQRMLANLLANALVHGGGGTVLVGARWTREGWRIEVRDDGPGIPESEQEAVFAELHQAGERAGAIGHGLGLSIVRRLGRLLGHAVTLRSAPGAGSCFGVLVPRVRPGALVPVPEARADVVPIEAARGGRLPGLRLLVVDDDEDVRAGLAGLLRSWGADVDEADGADGALAAVSAGLRPDLIVCDQRLGNGATGTRLLRALRATLGARVPAVLVSGEPPEPDDPDDRWLRKPLAPAQLRLAIEGALRRAS